jgi:enterochelin esterase-like enzyme
MTLDRRSSIVALLGLLTGCGGGGSDGGSGPSTAGTVQSSSIAARSNATSYPLSIYLPPASAGARASLPVVYLLDGEARFQTLVNVVEMARAPVIVVGIGNDALRNRDFVPVNVCTPDGGGEVAYFDFIRLQLVPFIESTFGGDPQRRILLGHSHGGSFVLFALFAEPAGAHSFHAYLAEDASIGCMTQAVATWESGYAAANASLPVRLQVGYAANLQNGPFVDQLQSRHYTGLVLTSQAYAGGHIGMIPAAFADGIAFATAA